MKSSDRRRVSSAKFRLQVLNLELIIHRSCSLDSARLRLTTQRRFALTSLRHDACIARPSERSRAMSDAITYLDESAAGWERSLNAFLAGKERRPGSLRTV